MQFAVFPVGYYGFDWFVAQLVEPYRAESLLSKKTFRGMQTTVFPYSNMGIFSGPVLLELIYRIW